MSVRRMLCTKSIRKCRKDTALSQFSSLKTLDDQIEDHLCPCRRGNSPLQVHESLEITPSREIYVGKLWLRELQSESLEKGRMVEVI